MRMARFAPALLVLALPAAADACLGSPPGDGFAFIHSALPTPLPDGVFIAEVEIKRADAGRGWRSRFRARVSKVVQGDSKISRIVLEPDWRTSCSSFFANGTSGLILGIPRGWKGKTPILAPIYVHGNDGYRLEDGYEVPIECRDKPCRPAIFLDGERLEDSP